MAARNPKRRQPVAAPAPPAPTGDGRTAAPPRHGRALRGLLSLLVPGLGQAARGRWLDGALLGATVTLCYTLTLLILNVRHGIAGELLALPFLDPAVAFRPLPEHVALFLLGVGVHGWAVVDALRAGENAVRTA